MWTARGPAHRQAGKEELIFRIAGAFIVALLVLAGCGGGKPANPRQEQQTVEEEKPVVPQTINVSGGEAEHTSGGAKPEKLWSVEWEKAQVDVRDKSLAASGVKGELYQGNKHVSNYSAEDAVADKETNRLSLRGNVRIESLGGTKGVLTCDELLYDANQKLLKARGHVKIQTEMGTLTSGSELWATADLKTVGTPETFKKK